MAWNVQNDMPSGSAKWANLCKDEKGMLAAKSGRYLKLANRAKFAAMPVDSAGHEGLRRNHSPKRKFMIVEAARIAANHAPQLK